ncbi:hypothetical protein [Kingella oralis]|uniref:Uncharacterized protein n=1 Tax=Kingella oralis ATCC 51147 TaxID=629741 RepID=C4GG09_9NEIS|nr:hypothetical protein [Kingella oralis]EEP69164.1 hypothetical protein GCWU000324_01076 [Kingella oralis ATCC 51147]
MLNVSQNGKRPQAKFPIFRLHERALRQPENAFVWHSAPPFQAAE